MNASRKTPNTHLTPAEVAQAIGASRVSVTYWIGLGCPVVRTGPLMLDLEEVRAWLRGAMAQGLVRPHLWRSGLPSNAASVADLSDLANRLG